MMQGISVIWKTPSGVFRNSAPQSYFSMRTTPPELRTRKPFAERDSTCAWSKRLFTYHMVCQNKNSPRCCKGKYALRARRWMHQTGMAERLDSGDRLDWASAK